MAGIAKLLELVVADLCVAYPKLVTDMGEKAIARQTSPPRIVWVIPGAAHGPAAKIGRPRSLLTRHLSVVAHVWGDGLAQLEELVEDTIVAVHKHAHGSVLFGGEDWFTDADVHRGMAALLRMTFDGPVIERRFRKANRDADQRVTRVPITGVEVEIEEGP